jgi:UDP-N-acetylmuramoylalanine--D-glutamate ligase
VTADPRALDGRRVAIVGLGASGLAAARVLAAEGATVRISEERPEREVRKGKSTAEAAGAEVLAGGHDPSHLDGMDLVVTSPGVPQGAAILRWARERRLPVWSELELGARLVLCPVIAVTGTNGKTTATEMVAAAMQAAGLDAIACGNVGYPFSLAAVEGHQALAVEASSFQLRFHRTLHPRVSVLLNLAPDHLDWHGSLDAYREAKRRVYARQTEGDTHVGNRDDAHAAEVSRDAPCQRVWFTLDEPRPGEVGYREGTLISHLSEGEEVLGTPVAADGAHRADAAAAAAAGLAFGLDADAVGRGVCGFAPLPHRGSVVAEVGGVRFLDDSKATNPHAVLAALRDMSDVVRLPVRRVASIDEAVREGYRLAPKGSAVVLAPGCASQDMFRDYRERGDRFAAAARELEQEVGARA